MNKMSLVPVTVIVPVKNEEANIGDCLRTLTDVSEVIVVDSGSDDRTCDIARMYEVDVVQFRWNGLFPKKRNWCLRNLQFKNPWVLFLDADERLTEQFKKELKRVLPWTTLCGFWVTYRDHFGGVCLRHGDPMRKLSLIRVGKGEYEQIDEQFWSKLDMEVHEHPVVQGMVGRIHSAILHRDQKEYEAYIDRHNRYSSWEARRFLDINHRGYKSLSRRQKIKYSLMDTWLLGPMYFIVIFIFKLGFLDGKAGLHHAINKMIYFFQIKYKIDEYRQLKPVLDDRPIEIECTSRSVVE